MVCLIFNTGVNKWFRKFKNKEDAQSFKQLFQMSVDDCKSVKVINPDDIPKDVSEIDDEMFDKIIQICQREVKIK